MLFHSSLLTLLGRGRVVGVERKIAPETRAALLQSPFAERISLVEGDSAAFETIEEVGSHISSSDKVMVILDSDHSRDHVAAAPIGSGTIREQRFVTSWPGIAIFTNTRRLGYPTTAN